MGHPGLARSSPRPPGRGPRRRRRALDLHPPLRANIPRRGQHPARSDAADRPLDATSRRLEALSQFFHAKSLLSSDAALAISHSTKADAGWLSDFPQDRIVVAHPGPSQCLLRHLHDRRVTRRPNVGLMVSTLEPRENADFVIDWFRSSGSLPEGTELWWVGRIGRHLSPRLIRDLQRSRRGRRIRLLGVVSDQRLCELYQTVGWSVYPSLYEGFGFPVLDSLRHGVPVLSSCHSSLREFAHPGVHFFDPHDAATLDRAWAECRAAGPNLISKAQLDELYNWDRVAQAILAVARRRCRRESLAAPQHARWPRPDRTATTPVESGPEPERSPSSGEVRPIQGPRAGARRVDRRHVETLW